MNYRHLKFWASQTFVLSALPLTFAIGIGAEVQAASFVFQAGNMDNFDTSDGIEAATPSAGLDQYIRNFFGSRCNSSPPLCEIRNFDERTVDKIFRHTINLNSVVGNITSAQLEIRVRGDGSGLNYNDTISLGFVDENAERNSVSWGRAIGSSNGSNGLLPTLWGQNEVHTFNFDLANLPLPNANTPNFISTLNALRFLDIHVQDDTSVDYVKLTIETEDEPPESVPEPSSLLGILGLGMLGFGTLKRRQKC